MPHLTFTKDQPLYVETAALLREAIQSGALPGNSRLDSVTGLAKKFHTSRKVVENALKLLKDEGLIVSFPGRDFMYAEQIKIKYWSSAPPIPGLLNQQRES